MKRRWKITPTRCFIFVLLVANLAFPNHLFTYNRSDKRVDSPSSAVIRTDVNSLWTDKGKPLTPESETFFARQGICGSDWLEPQPFGKVDVFLTTDTESFFVALNDMGTHILIGTLPESTGEIEYLQSEPLLVEGYSLDIIYTIPNSEWMIQMTFIVCAGELLYDSTVRPLPPDQPAL